jgi:lysophospholipase
VLDHRGQGSSDRMDTKVEMGHVDQFENYVSDLDNFLNVVVTPHKCKKRFLFAHSMGAGIGLTWTLKNEKYFDGLMISSPMLKIQTRPYSYAVAKSIVTAMMAIGKGNEFALGQKPFNANEPFETNKFTSSKARFKMTMDLYSEYPQAKLGGVSNRWLYEVMNGTRKLRSQYKKFKTPIHLYRAGIELYSDAEEMQKFCNEALQCQEMLLDSSKHEVVNDSDDNRNLVLYDMVMFLDHFKANDI